VIVPGWPRLKVFFRQTINQQKWFRIFSGITTAITRLRRATL
jgi:hypothetical protein